MSTRRKTDFEILQILKEEIQRLGLEDSPSRTKMQELYDRDKMPHPNTYVNRFGTWEKALEMIGIDYSGKKSAIEGSRKSNTGKRYASSWSNLSREEIIDATLSEIHSKGIRSASEYQNNRDGENAPSLSALSYLVEMTWSDFANLYKARFGANINEKNTNWSAMSDDDILELVYEEMDRIGSDLYVDFAEKRDREKVPSATTLANRGIPWSTVKKKFNNEYKNNLGENNND